MPTSASFLTFIGVGPAWASWPVIGDLEPAMPWTPWTTPMVFFFGLEDRALLDMGLEQGVDRPAADRLVAGIADALQLLAHGLAVEIGAGEAVIEIEHPAKTPEATMAGRKRASPPHWSRSRPRSGAGSRIHVVQRADPRARPARHRRRRTCRPVGWLSIWLPVITGARLLSLPGGGRTLPILSTLMLQPAPAPADEEIAGLLVEVGQRQAADPPFWVAPIFAISIRLSHRRSELTRRSSPACLFGCGPGSDPRAPRLAGRAGRLRRPVASSYSPPDRSVNSPAAYSAALR